MDFFDYSAAASGMTYRNSFNPAGIRIDGVPNAPDAGGSDLGAGERLTGRAAIVHSLAATRR